MNLKFVLSVFACLLFASSSCFAQSGSRGAGSASRVPVPQVENASPIIQTAPAPVAESSIMDLSVPSSNGCGCGQSGFSAGTYTPGYGSYYRASGLWSGYSRSYGSFWNRGYSYRPYWGVRRGRCGY